MTRDLEHEADIPRPPASGPGWVALAGIAGALIGAVGGITGSILVYRGNEEVQKNARHERIADIRRKSYSDLVSEYQTWAVKANGVRNLIEASIPLKGDEEEWKKAIDIALESYNNEFIPAHNKSRQTEVMVLLMGSKKAGDISDELTEARENTAGELLKGFGQGDGPYSGDRYLEIASKCDPLVKKFLSEVKKESLV